MSMRMSHETRLSEGSIVLGDGIPSPMAYWDDDNRMADFTEEGLATGNWEGAYTDTAVQVLMAPDRSCVSCHLPTPPLSAVMARQNTTHPLQGHYRVRYILHKGH